MIDQIGNIASVHNLADPVHEFPSLVSFHKDFAALPNNEKYFASDLSKFPMNFYGATIGAVPGSHKEWSDDDKMEWSGKSGVY